MRADVLIIGGGITARRAADRISKKYSVILASDGMGASPYIHGINLPILPEDSSELFLKDTLESGHQQNDRELASLLVSGSLPLIDELKNELDKNKSGEYDLLKPLGSTVPRVAGIGGKTGAFMLHRLCERASYKELSSTRAVRLIKSGEEVVGAYLFDKRKAKFFTAYARAVLIACGGFGGIFPRSTNSPDIGGDGIAMAYEAGAELVDMEFIQYEPTVATSPNELVGKSIITTMLFEGAVMRNKDGERFMDERVGKDALSAGIYREILRKKATDSGGVYYDMTAVPEEMLLGKYRGYFERYKRVGIDIRKTPVEIAPAPHTTMGGIRIDTRCRTSVPGLFAAGEAAGGVHGANRLGGNAGLEVFVFGDAAAASIIHFLDKDEPLPRNDENAEYFDTPLDLSTERSALHKICHEALGVIKSGEKLKDALGRVEKIVELSEAHPNSFEAVRLFNDSTTAKLALSAALARTESVGSHIRDDAEPQKAEKYRIILKKENQTLIETREILK